MVTRLGPAVLPLELDTAAARRALAIIRGNLVTIKELENDRRRTMGDIARTSTTINKNTKAVKKKAGLGVAETAAIAKNKRMAVTLLTGAALTGVFAMSEQAASAAGAAIEESSKEGNKIEQLVAERVNLAMQSFSNILSEIRARLTSVFPTAFKTGEITRAQLMLGERPGAADIESLANLLYDIEVAQKRSELQKNKLFKQQLGRWMADKLKVGGGP